MPPFFTRGSGHSERRSTAGARTTTPATSIACQEVRRRGRWCRSPGRHGRARGISIIAYGTSHWALIEARDQLRNEQKIDTSYCRLRGYPFNREIFDFIDAHDRLYVVDQNRDGQMWSLIKLECNPQQVAKLRSIRHYYGLPIDGRSLTNELLKQEGR
jgi:2-oxoglutarate ferredoxin oxidoreductase subunit alpha